MAENQSRKSPLKSKVLPNPKAQPIMSLVISNVGGPSAGKGTAIKRKKAVAGLLKTVHPNVVLFQEFPWIGIRRHSTWKNINIPKEYEYFGHKEASILYDKNELIVIKPNLTRFVRLHDEMTRKGELTTGFSPLGRMCILDIETLSVPTAHFLCISWHGSHNAKMEEEITDEFRNLLVFIEKIGNEMKLPYIIAGDFNLLYENASAKINQHTMAIYKYTPLKRRKGRLIDFYIASNTLPLADITAVDWETVEDGKDATKIFDHDPVFAMLMEHVPDPKRKSKATNKLSECERKSRKSQSN